MARLKGSSAMRAPEFLLSLVFILASIPAHASQERAAFDNSVIDKSFYYSTGSFIAPSELELVDGKVPVDGAHFVSPPNSLRLKWKSQTGGDWLISLKVKARYGTADFSGHALFFWCYSETDLTPDESPLIYLKDLSDEGTPTIRLTGDLKKIAAHTWTRVELPLDSFVGPVKSTRPPSFDPRHLAQITILQGLDDGKPHAIYLDEITVGDKVASSGMNHAAPSGLAAKGYDRQVVGGFEFQGQALIFKRQARSHKITTTGINRANGAVTNSQRPCFLS